MIFSRFFFRIGLNWRALVVWRIPNIEKQRWFPPPQKKIFFKTLEFLKKKMWLFEIFGIFWPFKNFWGFFGSLCIFFIYFLFLFIFGIFLNFWFFVLHFVILFGFFSNLLRVLLNIMEVITEHQKYPKISTNSDKPCFFIAQISFN